MDIREKSDISFEVKRLKEGELEAMSTIYEQYRSFVFRYAEKLMLITSDAEDLTQEVFEAMMLNGTSLKDERKIVPWMKSITYNLAMKKRIRWQWECIVEPEKCDEKDIVLQHIPEKPDEVMIQKERSVFVRNLLETLPENQKQVIICFFYQGMKIEQIAEKLDCPVGTVKTRLRSGKKKLGKKAKLEIEEWK